MTDMTIAEALALADQDSPMPHLAGQALKVLRERLMERNAEIEWMNREFERISCLFHNVGRCPECGCHDVEGLRGVSRDDGKMFRCTACGFVAGCKKWPPNPGAHLSVDVKDDSATLTKLIAELRAREALGRRKYGTDVDRTDLPEGTIGIEIRGIYDGLSVWKLPDGTLVNRWPEGDRRHAATQVWIDREKLICHGQS